MTIQSRRQPQSEKSIFPGKQISVSGVSLVWKIMELSDVEIDGTPTPQKQTGKNIQNNNFLDKQRTKAGTSTLQSTWYRSR